MIDFLSIGTGTLSTDDEAAVVDRGGQESLTGFAQHACKVEGVINALRQSIGAEQTLNFSLVSTVVTKVLTPLQTCFVCASWGRRRVPGHVGDISRDHGAEHGKVTANCRGGGDEGRTQTRPRAERERFAGDVYVRVALDLSTISRDKGTRRQELLRLLLRAREDEHELPRRLRFLPGDLRGRDRGVPRGERAVAPSPWPPRARTRPRA